MKLSLYLRLLLVLPVFALVLGGCSKDEETLKLADDILPNETYENTPLPESVLSSVTVCSQRTSCLINSNQTSQGEAVLYNDDDGNFYIDFNLNDGLKIKNIYLFVGLQQKQLPRYNNGQAAYDKYPYIKSFDNPTLQKFTYKLILGEDEQCWYVSAMVEVVAAGSENAIPLWMGCTAGGSNVDAFYVDKNITNGLYVGFCQKSCTPIDYTFAFEDLKVLNGNDMDYNDLVIQARYVETVQNTDQVSNISMTFFAKARGAAYDHEFSVVVPVSGASTVQIRRYNAIGELLSQESFSRNGAVNCLVFTSTKSALPPNGILEYHASNTDTTKDELGFPPCLVRSWKTVISINITNPAANVAGGNLKKPYDPYILVKPSNVPADYYTLHIHEITNDPEDLYEKNGVLYPNGVLVPSDWGWPLERVGIRQIHPDFPAPEWYTNIAANPPGYFQERYFGPPCF